MGQKHALTGLTTMAVVTIGLTAGFHQLGDLPGLRIDWTDPIRWLEKSSPEEAIGATLRSIGLLIGYWIAITSSLYLLASLRDRAHQPRLLTALTLPTVRRVIDRALATALAASIAASPLTPAFAEEPRPAPVVFEMSSDGIPVPHIRLAADAPPDEIVVEPVLEPTQATTRVTVPLPIVAPQSAPIPSTITAAATAAVTYTVQTGDNLWQIADHHLRALRGDDLEISTITVYWRQVVAANRDTVRSGDPNLIFPGEIVVLPELEPTP